MENTFTIPATSSDEMGMENEVYFKEEPITCKHGTLYPLTCELCAIKAKVCQDCDGIGEVSTMEQVWANEPHYAPVGSKTCENCRGTGVEPNEQLILERIYDL